MKKNLTPWGLLWISLTSMIGSGWLFGSLYSAHFAGPAAVLAWPIAGFLLLFVAMSYAEVAAMFPEANTLAKLPLYTHGRLTSVILSGLAWISLATIPVIETQGIMQYASNYWPALTAKNNIHYTLTPFGYLMAGIVLFSFVILNYFGIRLFARINSVFTIWKLLIPGLTIFVLLAFSYHPKNFSEFGGFMPYGWHGIMAAMSSGGVLFSLLGFRQVVIMMGEIENPGKYVPIVLVGSLVITTLLYTGLQWTFIGSLREQDLLSGWRHLSFPGDAGPFAALVGLAGLMWLSGLLYVDAFVSPYSTALVYSTTAAEMLRSMGEMGDLPAKLAEKNNYQVPWFSLLVNFIFAGCLFFLLKGWQAMASFLVAVMMITYTVGPLSLICLRKQLPDYQRPFRLRWSSLIAFVGFYICTAGVYWAGFASVLKLLVLIIIGLSAILFYHFFVKKSRHTLDAANAYWLIGYIVGVGIFSYFGNYGGKHFIPMYWDLVYLVVFCMGIFWWAVFSRKSNNYTIETVSFTELGRVST